MQDAQDAIDVIFQNNRIRKFCWIKTFENISLLPQLLICTIQFKLLCVCEVKEQVESHQSQGSVADPKLYWDTDNKLLHLLK